MSRPRTSQPTIKRVLGEYLAGGRKGRGRRKHDAAFAIELLESYLNSYAYESLEPAERRLFERRFNAEGREHREFCGIFGPERIVPALSMFLGWFLIRKVMARAEDLGRVAAELERLVGWLAERECIPAAEAAQGAKLDHAAAERLPRAERAAGMLRQLMEKAPPADDEDVLEGHFRVARRERGRLWLESEEDGRTYGPLGVPVKAAELIEPEWTLSGAVGRVGRRWVLLEVWNVYPEVGE